MASETAGNHKQNYASEEDSLLVTAGNLQFCCMPQLQS
jgi:hypothetical protein